MRQWSLVMVMALGWGCTAAPRAANRPPEAANPEPEMSWVEIKQAAVAAADAAHDRLDKVCKELETHLDADERKLLAKSQRAWIAFRDAQCEFEANYTGSGTDRAVNYPETSRRLAEERAVQLRLILEERRKAPGWRPEKPD